MSANHSTDPIGRSEGGRKTGPPPSVSRPSILVIRGGAIGDFLLTLPALRLLREGFPDCRIEIVGYRHICAVAEGRYYAEATRSIEYAPMAGFFNPRSQLDPGLSSYFSGFGQVISYLFDPDGFFEGSLRRCGVKNLIVGDPRVTGSVHAARHLAAPMESLALFLEEEAAQVFPSSADRAEAAALLEGLPEPVVAVHPGSGSEKKNWPLPAWTDLIGSLSAAGATVVVVTGESDQPRAAALRSTVPERVKFLSQPPLPALAAVFERCAFYIGHDTGISHLAAAAGAECLLLFGPTDPDVWAPRNRGVNVLRAPHGIMHNLAVDDVLNHLPAGIR